ncbi:MAG TPA: prepilin-type N-terminal cleavage/methylation domain-containing protein [Candidatus Xenobia bacterium]|nr:prepilin-type N-terminal cleavage/methylation domain-containing protein [Candidatus Xenobia bacterium]
MRNREKGFSLIELLIVVAIILIIAAIAIPNLLQSRQRANESSASGTLRTINTSEVTFQTTYGVGFANNLTRLGGPVGAAPTCDNAQLIDNVVGCAAEPCTKSGYQFNSNEPLEGGGTATGSGLTNAGCANQGMTDYAYKAEAQANQGKRDYYTGSSGVIRFCIRTDPATPCGVSFSSNALQ